MNRRSVGISRVIEQVRVLHKDDGKSGYCQVEAS